MKTINNWLDDYGESHKNETNKLIHWICVPTIFFTIVGLFYCIKIPVNLTPALQLNMAMVLIVLVTIYYLSLSTTIWLGMLLFGAFCLAVCYWIENYTSAPLWLVSVILFIAAWVGQFFGHKVEGKKPSFLG
jgi:uncharacterized membrane protein YGL010W